MFYSYCVACVPSCLETILFYCQQKNNVVFITFDLWLKWLIGKLVACYQINLWVTTPLTCRRMRITKRKHQLSSLKREKLLRQALETWRTLEVEGIYSHTWEAIVIKRLIKFKSVWDIKQARDRFLLRGIFSEKYSYGMHVRRKPHQLNLLVFAQFLKKTKTPSACWWRKFT